MSLSLRWIGGIFGPLHYTLRVHFPDRLRQIVWKQCSVSLWGLHWEVSLFDLWGFLQEQETIGGTSCCGSLCDSRSAQAGHCTSSALPQFITAVCSAADMCVCALKHGEGSAFITRSPHDPLNTMNVIPAVYLMYMWGNHWFLWCKFHVQGQILLGCTQFFLFCYVCF